MAASKIWRGPTTTLVEDPGSPRLECGDEITLTRSYRGLYSLCQSSAPVKGTLGSGDMAGYIVTKSTATRETGDVGTLVIVWAPASVSAGMSLPADEVSLEPFELQPRIERHANFSACTKDELSHIDAYISASTSEARDQAYNHIQNNGGAAAKTLIDLRGKGVETYYLAGMRYVHSEYAWSLSATTLGGYIDTPGGPLASYLPSSGMVWLRLSDTISWTGSAWKVTHTWLGGPSGHWSTDIYGS